MIGGCSCYIFERSLLFGRRDGLAIGGEQACVLLILKGVKGMKDINLKYGDEGIEVLEVQGLLRASGSSISLTGQYSVAMISAVRSFQKKNGLDITGKVDKKTYKLLRKQNSWWRKFFQKFCGHKVKE